MPITALSEKQAQGIIATVSAAPEQDIAYHTLDRTAGIRKARLPRSQGAGTKEDFR